MRGYTIIVLLAVLVIGCTAEQEQAYREKYEPIFKNETQSIVQNSSQQIVENLSKQNEDLKRALENATLKLQQQQSELEKERQQRELELQRQFSEQQKALQEQDQAIFETKWNSCVTLCKGSFYENDGLLQKTAMGCLNLSDKVACKWEMQKWERVCKLVPLYKPTDDLNCPIIWNVTYADDNVTVLSNMSIYEPECKDKALSETKSVCSVDKVGDKYIDYQYY